MLLELHIVNFATIERLDMVFENGMTVFTGETGAGKSIIIDAIGLLAGGRGSSDFVRHGTDKAEIEGLFDIDDRQDVLASLETHGIDKNDGMLIVRREISQRGKSICRINGKLATLSVLHDIGERLIDIHGQHDAGMLLRPEQHLPLIDRFGGDTIQRLKRVYAREYEKTAALAEQRSKMARAETDIDRRSDLLRFQINEIRSARLSEGEEEALVEEKQKLAHFEKIFKAVKTSYDALDGENRALDQLRIAVDQLASVQDLDGSIKRFAEPIASSFYMIEEQTSELRNYLEMLEFNPGRLDEIELRLNDLHLLEKKYGGDVRKILDYLTRIEEELDGLVHHDEHRKALDDAFRRQLDLLKNKAASLSGARKKTIRRLKKAINGELHDLCMDHAVFDIQIDQTGDLDTFSGYQKSGIDRAEFYIATNPGEPLKPLAKIASGGELSRIMLAIKSVFRQMIGLPTLIFDEVDTGVGGRVAQAMAEKIYSLSKSSQVLCITHLPQVAAMADQHMFISKQISENHRTSTHVNKLSEQEKVREIGRMISGAEMTDLTKEHAGEMLRLAKQSKS